MQAGQVFDLITGMGLLIVTFGKIETSLVLLASAPRLDEEPAYLSKWSVERLAKDVEQLARRGEFGDFSAEVEALVTPLRGNDGLIQRRNQYVHVLWKPAEDGSLQRTNLRRLVFEHHTEAVADFDVEDLAALVFDVGRTSDGLYDLTAKVWPRD